MRETVLLVGVRHVETKLLLKAADDCSPIVDATVVAGFAASPGVPV